MKRITPLFFVLAAVALIAGKQEDEKATLPHAGVPNVVPEERAALAKLREIDAIYAVKPGGHIT
jgi:hypothetical protein